MRSILLVVGCLGVLACILMRYWPESRQETQQFRKALDADRQDVNPLPPPQLAPVIARLDAGNTDIRLVEEKKPVIQQIRDLVKSNPKAAEKLVLEDQQRFPNSPDADERDALLVTAVGNQ